MASQCTWAAQSRGDKKATRGPPGAAGSACAARARAAALLRGEAPLAKREVHPFQGVLVEAGAIRQRHGSYFRGRGRVSKRRPVRMRPIPRQKPMP